MQFSVTLANETCMTVVNSETVRLGAMLVFSEVAYAAEIEVDASSFPFEETFTAQLFEMFLERMFFNQGGRNQAPFYDDYYSDEYTSAGTLHLVTEE